MQNGMLEQGDSGGGVNTLQQALTGHGVSPGVIDGIYGQGTVAAVIAFRKIEGLLPDGVAGPHTSTAPGVADSDRSPSAIPAVSGEIVGQMFPVTLIGNIESNLPPVLSALFKSPVSDRPMVSMALSTVRAEVANPCSLGK